MKYLLVSVIFLSFLFGACGSSTGSRYGKKDSSDEKTGNISRKEIKEEFDITPYKTTIDIEDTTQAIALNEEILWYGFTDSDSSNDQNVVINQLPGFRVLVYTSDVIEQAEYVKADVYFKTKKNTYLVFEPPFYKVKAGDFLKQSDASSFSFKLNQLGFSEAKVIRDSVNIYK